MFCVCVWILLVICSRKLSSTWYRDQLYYILRNYLLDCLKGRKLRIFHGFCQRIDPPNFEKIIDPQNLIHTKLNYFRKKFQRSFSRSTHQFNKKKPKISEIFFRNLMNRESKFPQKIFGRFWSSAKFSSLKGIIHLTIVRAWYSD